MEHLFAERLLDIGIAESRNGLKPTEEAVRWAFSLETHVHLRMDGTHQLVYEGEEYEADARWINFAWNMAKRVRNNYYIWEYEQRNHLRKMMTL